MPIVENDPWRTQYFEGIDCSDEVFIPTEDGDCYKLFPEHRWIYNKLLIAESQGLECGLHGITPEKFPVFSKPVYNMRGMGTDSRVFEDVEAYYRRQKPGHFWMSLLSGEHVSTDVVVVKGKAKWWRHVTAKPLKRGMFDYWIIEAASRPTLEEYGREWIKRNLKSYTGMVNFETIGNKIIECHLRFSDQWPDLYGKGWIESLVGLYTNKRWDFKDENKRTGYSVVLFGVHGVQYRKIEQRVIDDLLTQPEISSIQMTFYEDKPPEWHAMPPGGFRLAIINCWNLEAGYKARERLALHFWSTQKLRPRKPKAA